MNRAIALILLILTIIAPSMAWLLAQEDQQRPLEIVYPDIPGVLTPKTVGVALPDYVNYIFRFALLTIGFVIFGILIYNGILYVSSVGNPAALGETQKRILAAFLSLALLLGSWLIFTTINPQLVHLESKPLDPLRPVIMEGIYVCEDGGRGQSDLSSALRQYINGDAKQQIEAAKKIKEAMTRYRCLRLGFSGNFENFAVRQGQNTFFAVPAARVTEGRLVYDVYRYGLILHEKDRFRGKALLVTDPPYQPISIITPFSGLDFTAKSFTLFRKAETDPAPESKGVILYACLNYNDPPFACKKKGDESVSNAFSTGGADIRKIRETELQVGSSTLSQNTRSLQIDPVGGFFALLFSEDDFKGKTAEIIKSSNRNLQNNPIGQCGSGCTAIIGGVIKFFGAECDSCVRSMIVIKGQTL